jgi:hypothetical protein
MTGSFNAVQQSFKSVPFDGDSLDILQAKTVSLSTNLLINLAQGKNPKTAVPIDIKLGLTCEPSPRLVVVQKAPTLGGAATLVRTIGSIVIDDASVIVNEVMVTVDGVKGPATDYTVELGTLNIEPQLPGFSSGSLDIAIKENLPTNPNDPYYDCPKTLAVTNATGRFEVILEDASEIELTVIRATLNAGRTLLGTIPEAP